MSILNDYVANIEETCGEERHFIVMLRFNKRNEAMKKILERGKIKKSFSGLVYEISFKGVQMRLYKTGKILLKNLNERKEVEKILEELLK